MSLERVLLRSLLREIRELARLQRVRMSKSGDTRESDLKVKARAPLAPSGWGRGEYVLRRVDEERRVWSELFGRENEVGARRENEVGARIVQRALLRSEVSRDMEDGVRWTDVRSLVVQASRSLGNEGTGSHAVVDAGLAALRVIAEQRELTDCTAVTTTPSTDDGVDMVHVEATSRYIPWVSTEGRSVFAYRIYIENVHPSRTCRLLARHWIFRKAGGEVVVEVPRGSRGVVGFTPILKPGQAFEYMSGTGMPCSYGTMEGSFQMIEVAGSGRKIFDASAGCVPLRAVASDH